MASKQEAVSSTPEYPPQVLRDYSLLADGERGVLVGPRGDFAWMCAPTWDSDAVFSLLLGGAGVYALTPAEQPFIWGGFYERGSLIWHSRWVTTSQSMESREALALPGDRHTAVVLRRVLAVDGVTRVRVVLDPRAGFGRYRMKNLKCDGGVWTARSGPLYLRWSGAPEASVRSDGALETVLSVDAGDVHDLVLELSDRPLTEEPVHAGRAWEGTVDAWRHAVRPVTGTIADGDARQAYAVLRGLTSSGGGMAAAATMGLPERAEEGRNYDYRYAWIRDQCYAGCALAAYGPHPLLDDAVRFVCDRILEDGPNLKPAYTVYGGPVPDERYLDLAGYPGGTPKVGNWVNRQFQLDAFGEALLLFAAAADCEHLGPEQWRAAEVAIAAIADRWREPDSGIWELDDRCWAHSRLSCAAGLRAIAAYAPSGPGARWNALADAIVADTAATCLHPSGRWQRAPDDERIDASLLIPAVRGAVPADDPRTLATLDAALDELGDDGFMYRFRPDKRPLGHAEGAFVLCGLQASLALHQQGREVEAHRWFERNRAACGPPGLYAEEFDLAQRQLRGNLPQAFVHALLLESAKRLAEPWPEP
ncbi:MAG: glycoside hydrolase family 15 protein [Catenulispora sp.]|nr:glycoside hydrolase family 15 protein [Catenulispora sp.]